MSAQGEEIPIITRARTNARIGPSGLEQITHQVLSQQPTRAGHEDGFCCCRDSPLEVRCLVSRL